MSHVNIPAIMQYFSYEHLTQPKMRTISQLYAEMAILLYTNIPEDTEQRRLAFTLLLQSKDAAVRAALD
jgi:hypothetical protein